MVAATAAACQAAQLHYVWRDNRDSQDGRKRHYSASLLSLLALSLRPASRFGSAYVRQEYSSVAERQQQAVVAAPALSSTVIV